jgi:hypothetical protein
MQLQIHGWLRINLFAKHSRLLPTQRKEFGGRSGKMPESGGQISADVQWPEV